VGIKPILNSVPSKNHQVLKLTISLVLVGVLSGCAVSVWTLPTFVSATAIGLPKAPGKNYYKPIVLASNEDMIRIKYLSAGSNAQRERVLKLIADQCDDSYIETSRKNVQGWVTVKAECLHETDS